MKGLTEKEVVENRKKYGSNVISSKKKDGFFKLFIEALGDPIIKILLTALAIKTIFLFQDFDWFENLSPEEVQKNIDDYYNERDEEDEEED